jgi:hypothetical protein
VYTTILKNKKTHEKNKRSGCDDFAPSVLFEDSGGRDDLRNGISEVILLRTCSEIAH